MDDFSFIFRFLDLMDSPLAFVPVGVATLIVAFIWDFVSKLKKGGE
jgi:hypothetical protein